MSSWKMKEKNKEKEPDYCPTKKRTNKGEGKKIRRFSKQINLDADIIAMAGA
jgi:hypothetical protein